ncbi:MAG: shikimate dehydrogenase [Kiritimatiellae bacterium]|nr:shikimate dehydrogenase [Kiritimatiellia bacterium]
MDMHISGHTKPFAVLGHPIGHTLSPVMHNASLRALGLDAIYLAFDVDPERLIEVLHAMKAMGFAGVNLTVPLKEVAFRGLADLDESARRLGAVNTVKTDGPALKGFNTDGAGFLLAVEEAFGCSVEGKTVFVLGNGGAGRAVAITCAVSGAGRLLLSDVATDRSARLKEEIEALAPSCGVSTVDPGDDVWAKTARETDLVVQATPVGMKAGDKSLLGPDAFRAGQMVFDLVYMYPETDFIRVARARGAEAANGLGMLLHQGAHAFAIWTGQQAATDVMRSALEEAVYGK